MLISSFTENREIKLDVTSNCKRQKFPSVLSSLNSENICFCQWRIVGDIFLFSCDLIKD